MNAARWIAAGLLAPILAAHAANPPGKKAKSCVLTIEGEVKRGENFRHAGPAGLDFMLEAIPSGWIVRMLDSTAPRGEFDYAGLATPPYISPNPILISTDFAFRAQDAIGWNPRSFQYFRTPAVLKEAIAAYRQYTSAPPNAPTAQSQQGMAKLLQLSARAAPAKLEILDAHLIGGTRNQTAAASLVATHFLSTAHVVEQSPTGPSPLGMITLVRFRVSFPEVDVPCKSSDSLRH
ncbi:MAG: hypothetical protein JSS87_04440 [Acidobacteria bacterium]|nr:hypothetical protein [Acidobacteriota bacterium]